MTYRINGTQLDPQPTTGQWQPRQLLGIDGAGRPIYAPTRQFEMTFNLLNAGGYNTLQDYFLAVAGTGTVIVDLPIYTSGSYAFQSYTGCYIREPESGPFFAEHYQETRLLVTNIITEK